MTMSSKFQFPFIPESASLRKYFNVVHWHLMKMECVKLEREDFVTLRKACDKLFGEVGEFLLLLVTR